MRRFLTAVATALAMGMAPACSVRGRPLDTTALIAELGLDGAAEALRIRIAGDPTDVAARRALAAIEVRRGRPGAVLAELDAVRLIGGPLGARLSSAEQAQLALLYRERADVRSRRGSPDALADLDLARAIGDVGDRSDPTLRRTAELLVALADLRDSDPDKRARGARRLDAGEWPHWPTIDAAARALPDPEAGEASIAELADAGVYLWERGARRVALELLDVWERRILVDGDDREDRYPELTYDAWMSARVWWGGARNRPDLATLQRAVALGASPCHFAVQLGDHGCSAVALSGADIELLVERAWARGWRTDDPAEAAGWVAVTARAWLDGEIGSWLDELDARVDLAALGAGGDGPARLAASIPAWARSPLLRAAGRGDEAALALERAIDSVDRLPASARLVVALEAALGGASAERIRDLAGPDDANVHVLDELLARAASPPAGSIALGSEDDVLAAAVARPGDDPVALAEVVRAFRRDPAAGGRVGDDVIARDIDVARAAPMVAELFGLLGDPARSRTLWERAVAASPQDPVLRAGLVGALAAAGDGAAAQQELTTAAAGSGDAGRALLDGARVIAAAGLPIDALPAAKQAVELTAPGEQQELLAFLIELAGGLGRDDQVRAFTVALAAQQSPRDTTTLHARGLAGDATAAVSALAADPADAALAVIAAAGADDAAAVAILQIAARWNPRAVPVRAAIASRAAQDSAAYRRAMGELAAIAADHDVPAIRRIEAARAWMAAH